MSNEEVNPAEAAAEEILKEAYAEAQAEECPQGKDCAVHFRVNEEYFEEKYEYARLIDYVGEFVVITDDNPAATSVLTLALAALNGSAYKRPPRWETSIYYVGEGVIGDLTGRSEEERRKAFRYYSTHDVWEEVKGFHQTTVNALTDGLIDVSKPVL